MEHITKTLLENLRIHLETHQITLDTDSMIDFLFQHYSEFVPVSTETTLKKYKAVAMEVLELIKEREALRAALCGMKSPDSRTTRNWRK